MVPSTETFPNGYCGTFIFSNGSGATATITLQGAINSNNYKPIVSINIPTGTCQTFRLYCYGYASWTLLKQE